MTPGDLVVRVFSRWNARAYIQVEEGAYQNFVPFTPHSESGHHGVIVLDRSNLSSDDRISRALRLEAFHLGQTLGLRVKENLPASLRDELVPQVMARFFL